MGIRRGLSQGLQSASDTIGTIIERMLLEDSQRKQAEYVYGRQMDLQNLTHRNQVTRMLMEDPALADRLAEQGGLPEGLNASPYRLLPRQRMGGVLGDVNEGTTPQTQVGPEMLQSMMAAAGVEDRPSIDSLMKARAERESAIQTELQNEENAETRLGPGGVSGFIGRGGGFIPTERTGEQEGQRDLAQALAGELSPAMADAEADKFNTISTATRGAKRADSFANAYGSEAGTINSRWDNRDKLIETEQGLAGARAGAGQQNSASAMVAPMFVASRQAEALENEGAKITEITQIRATSPLGAAMLGRAGNLPVVGKMFTPRAIDAEYTQAAINYATIVTRIMSGVQARQDERDIFVNNNFTVLGDDKIKGMVEAKKNARRVFDMAVMAGQGPDGARAAGHIVGQALKSGQLTWQSIEGITLSPEFSAGMQEGLR